jgi:hypothetical protein
MVDVILAKWRQGDCVLGDHWLAVRVAPELPLSVPSVAEQEELVPLDVVGLVVVTQTCDIVRPCAERPFVEVSPIVEVDADDLHLIERGHRPKYGFIPALAGRRLVADLDRTMTVEKPVLTSWERIPGCTSDTETRAFASALARKRARFAYPDDFSHLAKPLIERLAEKHDRRSPEGASLRALREIRVIASPTWDAPRIELQFLFIRDEADMTFGGKPWTVFRDDWLKLVSKSGRFEAVDGNVWELADLTAAEYVASDALDLDYLSTRTFAPPVPRSGP